MVTFIEINTLQNIHLQGLDQMRELKEFLYTTFFTDQNERAVKIYKIEGVEFTGTDLYYPNVRLRLNNKIINPIDERIMSLLTLDLDHTTNLIEKSSNSKRSNQPVFYFIYNTDNYFHFLYDTVPYLISYLKLKSETPNLKLLMNFPNYQSKKLYSFVLELLQILEIDNDIILIDEDTVYETVFVSSSYTHGYNSNSEPNSEIYLFYKQIVDKVKNKFKIYKSLPTKIYVSRRSWLHNDFSNIGTNYTQKRKLVNEDELVDYLKSKNYVEIFTENLSFIEKIHLFYDADSVVSAIGGGSCNLLFSRDSTNHVCVVSPTFLNVNKRFIFSLNQVRTTLFESTSHYESGYWKKYMRVKCGSIVGEIEDVLSDKLLISYTDRVVAGWNSNLELKYEFFDMNNCIKLDEGLNSHWYLDMNEFKMSFSEL